MKTPEDEAFDELARKQGDWGGGFQAKRAMAADKLHWSDCAVHNGPAYPAGECDCGAAQKTEREALKLALEVMQINLTLLEKIDPYKGQEDLLSDSLALTHEAIASIEAALEQPAQDGKCKLCVDGCIACDARAQPAQEPVAQWLEDAFREGWESYRDSEFASKITEDWAFGNSLANCRMIDLQQNTALPLPAQEPVAREWNFCERCGKRTADLTVIHTCTPPQEGR
jgi:hypothetical protein